MKLKTSKYYVRTFFGIVNFYNKFIPNASSILHPLYKFLKKDYKFIWSKSCVRSFNKIKEIITLTNVLEHFDPKYPIKLTVNA